MGVDDRVPRKTPSASVRTLRPGLAALSRQRFPRDAATGPDRLIWRLDMLEHRVTAAGTFVVYEAYSKAAASPYTGS